MRFYFVFSRHFKKKQVPPLTLDILDSNSALYAHDVGR